MQRYKFLKNQKGFLLMESLIALAVIVIVMTALVTALVSSINSSTFSSEQSIATAYAQEGLDVARTIKNRDFGEFDTTGYNGLCKGESTFDGSTCLIDGKYERIIYINSSGKDARKTPSIDACNQSYVDTKGVTKNVDSVFVASTVSWSDSRCSSSTRCHKVDLTSCFVNLNYIEGP